MLLVLKREITEEEKSIIQSMLFERGCIVREITGAGQNVIGAVGGGNKDVKVFEKLPGVEKVIPVSTAFKLVSRQMHPEDTRVRVGDVTIGGERIAVAAGPCAIENREQAMAIAHEVKKY